MSRRLTQKDCIDRFVAKHGDKYSYAKFVYVSNHTAGIIDCPEHGEFLQRPSKHFNGQGCPKCLGRHRTQEEAIERLVSVHGDTYDYNGVVFTKIHDYINPTCKAHGPFKIRYIKHQSGQGCPVCRYVKSSAHHRHSKEEFIRLSEKKHGKRKFDYSNVDYVNNNTEVEITCENGHTFMQLPSVHKSGNGCSICSGKIAKTTQSFIAEAKKVHGDDIYDYSDTEYKGIFDKLWIGCITHGKFLQIAKDHLEGCGCPSCPTAISKPEAIMSEYIRSLGFDVKTDTILSKERKLRFDCVVESKKIVFEFNGCWHHRYPTKEPMYHVDKRRYAESLGYQMVSIWEDDWLIKNDRIKELIKRKLCGVGNKIAARKTIVKKVGRDIAAPFHELHHLQDFSISAPTQHYALYKQEEMVAVASFDNKGVLHRYTIKSETAIFGGMEKLISAFKKDNGDIDITTYCDMDYFNGKLYQAIGFKKVSETKQLTYLTKGRRVRREKFMKHKLHAIFGEIDLNKTENEICAENGVYACYNSGIDKYVLYRSM